MYADATEEFVRLREKRLVRKFSFGTSLVWGKRNSQVAARKKSYFLSSLNSCDSLVTSPALSPFPLPSPLLY